MCPSILSSHTQQIITDSMSSTADYQKEREGGERGEGGEKEEKEERKRREKTASHHFFFFFFDNPPTPTDSPWAHGDPRFHEYVGECGCLGRIVDWGCFVRKLVPRIPPV